MPSHLPDGDVVAVRGVRDLQARNETNRAFVSNVDRTCAVVILAKNVELNANEMLVADVEHQTERGVQTDEPRVLIVLASLATDVHGLVGQLIQPVDVREDEWPRPKRKNTPIAL